MFSLQLFNSRLRFLIMIISLVIVTNSHAEWSLHESPFFSDFTKFQRLESGPLLVGTRGGLFVSFDEGSTWDFSNLGSMTSPNPGNRVEFDAVELDDGTVFVVMDHSFRADADLVGFTRVAWPGTPKSVEASGDTIWISGNNEIHRSLDHGENWDQVYSVPNNYDDLMNLRRNPANGSLISQITRPGGLFLVVSSDGGLTWTEQTLGGVYGEMAGLEYADDGTLWIAHNYYHDGFLRTTTDNGASTQVVYSAPNNMEIGDLTLGPANRMAMTQGAGTVVSFDGGSTFESRFMGVAHPSPLFFTGGERLLAGIRSGVLISEDEGTTWTQTSDGLWADFLFEAEVTPGGTTWMLSSGNLWHDANGDWQLLDMPGGVGQQAHVLRSTSTGRIILMGQESGTPEGFYTDDNGTSWHLMTGLDSTDSWSPFASVCEKNGVLYAGHEGLGLFVSTDNGATWVNRSTEPLGEISVAGDGSLWAILYSTLRHSTDDGFTWNTITSVSANNTGVASPVSGAYVVSTFVSVERSLDGGSSWSNVFNNAWSVLGAAHMAADDMLAMSYTAEGDLILAVSVYNQMTYRNETRMMLSSDDGDTFVDITDQSIINRAVVETMRRSAEGGLIACTNQGIYGDAFTGSETAVWDLPGTLIQLGQNQPNPFNPRTVIPFSLPRESHVRLTITNLRGARLATLVDRVMPPGLHETPFNGNQLASGVYFYQLEVAGRVVGQKMTLLK